MLGDDYNYDSTVSFKRLLYTSLAPIIISVLFSLSGKTSQHRWFLKCVQNTFRALYRTFTECCFIEDKGDIVFYKNRKGEAARVVADDIDS